MIKLNLGSGPYPKEGWDSLDLVDHPGIIKHDLTTRLPYEDNSVDFAFSEHFVEHLSREQGLAFLKEVRRVLKPHGTFRIVIPDLYVLAKDYVNGHLFQIPGCWEPKTTCQMINEGFRSWGHSFLYDEQELSLICIEAGFRYAYPKEYRQSINPELQNLEIRPFNNELIVEVVK